MTDSPVPLNRCPPELVPLVLEIIETETGPTRSHSEPFKTRQVNTEIFHEKTVVLQDEDFDHLMALFSRTSGSFFSCHDARNGMDYALSFREKPEVLKLQLASNSKQYTVRVHLVTVLARADGLSQ